MIIIKKSGAAITLTRGDQTFTLPVAEAPALIAALLDQLGVSGTRYQQGYQTGLSDGLLEGYARRDREYVVAASKGARAELAQLRARLLASLDSDATAA